MMHLCVTTPCRECISSEREYLWKHPIHKKASIGWCIVGGQTSGNAWVLLHNIQRVGSDHVEEDNEANEKYAEGEEDVVMTHGTWGEKVEYSLACSQEALTHRHC